MVSSNKPAPNRVKYLIDGKLECRKCSEWKPLEDYHKSKSGTYGVVGMCKVCALKKAREYRKDKLGPGKPYAEKTKIYQRQYHLKTVYGLTVEEYQAIWDKQSGRCDICDVTLNNNTRDANSAHLDHCHKTSKVRGILCSTCNRGIGYMKDNTETLKNAAKYLRKHKPKGGFYG